jgi:hypothetical protein
MEKVEEKTGVNSMEHLPSVHKTLGFIPSITKKKKKDLIYIIVVPKGEEKEGEAKKFSRNKGEDWTGGMA